MQGGGGLPTVTVICLCRTARLPLASMHYSGGLEGRLCAAEAAGAVAADDTKVDYYYKSPGGAVYSPSTGLLEKWGLADEHWTLIRLPATARLAALV